MTTYTLATAPQSYQLSRIINDDQFVTLGGAVQAVGRTGNRFALSLSWVRGRSDFRTLVALIDQLHGMRHRLSVPMSKLGYIRAGVGGGTPLVNGAHSAGAVTLSVKGMTISTTGVLQPGDFVQVGNQLCRAVTILSSDGSGNGSCTIFPELHKGYSDGASIDYDTPEGAFIWQADSGIETDHAGIGRLTAEFVQDVLA